jgi:hypothetical protein
VKFVAFSLPCLLSVAATCAVYGWLEATANMIEGLALLFAPGATTVVFAPILLLFIGLGLAIFVTGPMFAAALVPSLAVCFSARTLSLSHELRSDRLLSLRSFATLPSSY